MLTLTTTIMDFKDSIKQLSERIEKLKGNILTEEATKNAFIMPFITALGYDVFNPLEVVPEMVCDIGMKKGEKIDYAIMKDDKPIILIECKHWEQDLNDHCNQLVRYFNVSEAKFGLLTNGIIYRFYTDIDEKNKMDNKPFFEVNLTDIKDNQVEELKKFHKSYFDVDNVLGTASELKYLGELKSIVAQEISAPSAELVKCLSSKVYNGRFSQQITEYFTPLIKKAFTTHINEMIADRLKSAIEQETKEPVQVPQEPTEDKTEATKVVTTEEELEGYLIVKSILRETIDVSRVFYRDAQSYFSVLMDDNNRKPLCRLYLNGNKKHLALFNENKQEEKHLIESLNDIFAYSEHLKKTAQSYE